MIFAHGGNYKSKKLPGANYQNKKNSNGSKQTLTRFVISEEKGSIFILIRVSVFVNRVSFSLNTSKKGSFFSKWSTLMGYKLYTEVGVPGLCSWLMLT